MRPPARVRDTAQRKALRAASPGAPRPRGRSGTPPRTCSPPWRARRRRACRRGCRGPGSRWRSLRGPRRRERRGRRGARRASGRRGGPATGAPRAHRRARRARRGWRLGARLGDTCSTTRVHIHGAGSVLVRWTRGVGESSPKVQRGSHCNSPNRQIVDPRSTAESGQKHVSGWNLHCPEKRSTNGPGAIFPPQIWTLGPRPKKGPKSASNCSASRAAYSRSTFDPLGTLFTQFWTVV